MAFPYRLIRTKASGGLGTGAEALGFLQPQTLPLNDGFFRRGYAVLKSFGTSAPGYVKTTQQFAAVDLVGNGSNIQGQLDLQALARLSGGK